MNLFPAFLHNGVLITGPTAVGTTGQSLTYDAAGCVWADVPGRYSAENRGTTTLQAGCPVTPFISGVGYIAAQADSPNNRAVGLLQSSVGPNFAEFVQTIGVLRLSNWTAVVGTTTLVVGGRYFLSTTTAGMMTLIVPTGVGKLSQLVGEAVSPQELKLSDLSCFVL